MYLLDTNVISELRKSHKANPNVRAWAKRIATRSLYLSAVTILEIETGILQIARKDLPQADRLRQWLETIVLPTFTNRILSVDTAVARASAKLHIPNKRPDRDAMIAGTAITYGLAIVTRNVRDFDPSVSPIINPWEKSHSHTHAMPE